MKRIRCYIDGFNLYHAIDDLGDNRLKWLDLMKMTAVFTDPAVHKIDGVHYFSAIAEWLPDAAQRHRLYISALQNSGVDIILGQFKNKQRQCNKCKAQWTAHEEKETDVNIALYMVDHAYRDMYDEALLISRDSDLAPALRLLKNQFPNKNIKVISPPALRHSKEMAQIVGQKNLSGIKQIHIERSQFPDTVFDSTGKIICHRPSKYKKP